MHHNFIPVEMLKQITNRVHSIKIDEETLENLTNNSFIHFEYVDMEKGLKINRIFQNEIRQTLRKKKDKKKEVIDNLEAYIKSIFNSDAKKLLNKKDFSNIKKIIDNIYFDLEEESKYLILNNFADYCIRIKKFDSALINYKKLLDIKLSSNEMIGKLINDYKLIEKIGEGRYGSVYKVEHVKNIQNDKKK